MKTLFFVIINLSLIGLIMEIPPSNFEGENIQATMARSSDCTIGRGVCSFGLLSTETETMEGNTIKINVSETYSGSLKLQIAKSELTITQFEEQFIDMFFYQADIFQIDNNVLEALNINSSNNTILPGYYSVEENDTYFEINLANPLSENEMLQRVQEEKR